MHGLLSAWSSHGAQTPFTLAALQAHVPASDNIIPLAQVVLGPKWAGILNFGDSATILPRQAVMHLFYGLDQLREQYEASQEGRAHYEAEYQQLAQRHKRARS